MSDGELPAAGDLRRQLAEARADGSVARAQAERTDPWRWYCRICGAKGADPSRVVRNDQALDHAKECPPGGRPNIDTSETGRLLHVWSH